MSYVSKLKVNVDGREFRLTLNGTDNASLHTSLHSIIDMCHHIMSQVDCDDPEPRAAKEKPVAPAGFEDKAIAAAEEAVRLASQSSEYRCTSCERSVFARAFPTGWKQEDDALTCNECQLIEGRKHPVAITCFQCGLRSYDVVDDLCSVCREGLE